jgi:ABC-type transport system involved in multi-copper enzyme maturation permease subunit/regulation of enolase protein 1 (concanavalin A-like superfamily)
MILAALVTVGIALLDHSSCGIGNPGGGSGAGCPAPPVGPGGEAVTDSFYFVHQPLAGNGSITVRLTSLTGQTGPQAGLPAWSKAGIIIKASTRPGSAYAAMMVTAGHGVRMQYDYTGDIAGRADGAPAASPRWLRLTRTGDMLTGYESADGTRWTRVGTAALAELPRTVQAGLFAASPAGSAQLTSQSISGSSAGSAATAATARFDHVVLRSHRPGGAWAGDDVGGTGGNGSSGTGFHQAAGTVTVTGSGDIAPDVAGADGAAFQIDKTLVGVFGALIAVAVVATMFMTAEYRRGLIRLTLAASPRRGRVLAAKAIVIGSVTFLAGLAGAGAAVPLGERLLRSNGNHILPVSAFTELRVVAGTAALLAVAAVLALALGAILRHSAAAVTAVILAIVLPYFFSTPLSVLPAGASDWLLRVTPAAAFAIQQSTPQYPQVSASYTPMNGYFPLAPWAGFAVLGGYAVLALGLAFIALRRRDA